jgi:uncharacterized protein (TIGR03663 family)
MVQVQERVQRAPVPPPEPVELPPEEDVAPRYGWVPFALIAAVGFVARIWDLGSRAMHHDESLHALYSWYLYVGKGYQHDPMMHGPFLFHSTALMYLLFGDSEVTFRLPYVLLGTASIFLMYFLRHELGRWGAIAAAVLLAFEPVFLYFSRFGHNEALLLFQELLTVVGLFGWYRTRRSAYLYAATIGLGLMFATKMTWAIFGFILFTFVVYAVVMEMARGQGRRPVYDAIRDVGWRRLGICVAIVLGIAVTLYTTFFTNMTGLCTALWSPGVGDCTGKQGMIQYWMAQQHVARGSQPPFYYFLQLPLYAPVSLVLGIAALFLAPRPRNLFFFFAVWWAVGTIVIYSIASEKMPWLVVHVATPLAVLGGFAVQGVAQHVRLPWVLTPRQWGVAGLGLLAVAAFVAWVSLGVPPGASQLVENSVKLRKVALGLVIAALVFGAVRASFALTARQTLATAGGVLLGLLMLYSAHASLQAVYKNGDIPVEMLVYVQSSPDVPFIVDEVDRLSNQLGLRKDMPVLLDGGYSENVGGQQVEHEAVSWPFEWYFRDYKAKSYYTRTLPGDFSTNKYPMLIAMGTNLDPIKDQLGNYTGNKFRLNWWYPEDYKQITLDNALPTIWYTISDAEARAKLMKYIIYRDLMNPTDPAVSRGEKSYAAGLGARELWLYVRNDLVASGSPLSTGTASSGVQMPSSSGAPAVAPAAGGPALSVAQVYGSRQGQQVIRDPKGIAVGPDGRIYVADVGNSTITVLNRDGSVATAWGSKGTGDGQMNEPWGIAVGLDGSVYVADTWNHRVQKFDANGRFVAKWGGTDIGSGNGQFYGPRDVAITPSGQVLVTDTGNKRIQVFDQNGAFIRAFGTEGTGSGQFREPVGLAVDAQGKVYVADTWNERIQVFDASYQPLGSYPVGGWGAQTVTNKPYIAVAPDGTVYATQPDRKQIVRVKDGLLSVVSLPSTPALALPSGVKVDPAGRLLVTDTTTNTVVAYELPMASSAVAPDEPLNEPKEAAAADRRAGHQRRLPVSTRPLGEPGGSAQEPSRGQSVLADPSSGSLFPRDGGPEPALGAAPEQTRRARQRALPSARLRPGAE